MASKTRKSQDIQECALLIEELARGFHEGPRGTPGAKSPDAWRQPSSSNHHEMSAGQEECAVHEFALRLTTIALSGTRRDLPSANALLRRITAGCTPLRLTPHRQYHLSDSCPPARSLCLRSVPTLVRRHAVGLVSFAVPHFRRKLHPQECANAECTCRKAARRRPF